jgi:hypothetical protein
LTEKESLFEWLFFCLKVKTTGRIWAITASPRADWVYAKTVEVLAEDAAP